MPAKKYYYVWLAETFLHTRTGLFLIILHPYSALNYETTGRISAGGMLYARKNYRVRDTNIYPFPINT